MTSSRSLTSWCRRTAPYIGALAGVVRPAARQIDPLMGVVRPFAWTIGAAAARGRAP